MKKLRKLSSIHKQAWKLMSEYVRRRDDGLGCISCGIKKPWKEMQAGHLIHGNSMDFHMKNINSQCLNCNYFLSGNGVAYAVNIDKKWGTGTAEELLSLKHKIHKFTRGELEAIILALKIKIEELSKI